MRQIVSIKPITEIKPIDGADAIECAIINSGWPVVVKKNEFQVGDNCVYFEIDSFLPIVDERFSFLEPRSTTWQGKQGARIKTMKLRGQLSQGLALPLSLFPEFFEVVEDTDLAALISVEKWERPMNAQLAGNAKGNFPSFIFKTDQERCQNLVRDIFETHAGEEYEATLKLDGSSFTGYRLDDTLGVCSRNLELKFEDNENNSFVKTFIDTNLGPALESLGMNIAVQGELMGPGIQGNREKFETVQLFVFDIFLIDEKRYAKPEERYALFDKLTEHGFTGKHIPIHSNIKFAPKATLADLLALAEGASLNHHIREGLVFKSLTTDFTFKAISNAFLLKGGD
jgi:RNA ligase (TIGR02306 family)